MPLTEKGEKIKSSMTEEYGKKKGEQVFYASKNAGRIKGVDRAAFRDAVLGAKGKSAGDALTLGLDAARRQLGRRRRFAQDLQRAIKRGATIDRALQLALRK